MNKKWKISLECPVEQQEDSKVIYLEAKDETDAFTKLGRMPENQVHCPHGVLKVININTEN